MDSNDRFREGGHRRLGGLISCTREFSGAVIRRCGCRGPQEYRSYERDRWFDSSSLQRGVRRLETAQPHPERARALRPHSENGPARRSHRAAESEDPAVIVELPYSESGCFDGWASAKAGMAMQVL